MKPRIPSALAALLLACAVPLAHSQSTIQPPANLVDEPVASVSRSDDVANAIAQALIADPLLKHSKITVQPEDSGILLTGSALTDAQKRRASQIAVAHAGEGNVSNTILTDEIVLWAPPPVEQPVAELAVKPESSAGG